MDRSSSGELKAPVSKVEASPATLTAQVIVKDKDGKIKYQGPLVMAIKEKQDGSDSFHRG